MTPTPTALPTEVSLLRLVAQGLVPATTAPVPAEAVRRQLAIQGQQVSAVPHALVVRAAGATRGSVDAAFDAGELVRSWPMRGTVHITTAADHHWLRVALRHRTAAWVDRSEKAFGIDDAVLSLAARTAFDLLDEQGPVPRADLLDAWAGAGLMEPFDGQDVSSYRRRHLLVRLQREGLLVQGPRRGNEHLVVDARALPGPDTGPAGCGVARGEPGHAAACAEIARRYATSHGPVTAADLARWTTLPLGEAARALENAVELTNASDYAVDAGPGDVPLVRAAAGRGRRGDMRPLSDGTRASRATTLYMRADLPDLLDAGRGDAARTHFLGSFDEVHVGYKDRSCLTDADGERLICPAANGMFRPLLVDRGRVVAVRPVGEGLVWADGVRRSARLERDVERAVRRVTVRLSDDGVPAPVPAPAAVEPAADAVGGATDAAGAAGGPPGTGVVVGEDGLARPPWASVDPLLRDYYDTEWGMPVRDERGVFERLSLEAFQSGLSWVTILRKRPAFREAFDGFDPERVAEYGDAEIERLVADARIVRNRAKILATISNARATLGLRERGGLVDLVWSFRPTVTPAPCTVEEVPTTSPESVALSRALRREGFSFVGPTTVFALMEAIGIVDTHLLGSHRRGTSGVWPT